MMQSCWLAWLAANQMYIATFRPGPSMSNIEAFTLRLKPALLRFVREIAEEQNRSVPNYIETVLLAEKKRHEAQLNQRGRESGPEQA